MISDDVPAWVDSAPLDVRIRAATPTDVLGIEAVTIAAFLDAPHAGRTEQRIVSALRGAGELAVSIVAEADGTLVGFVAASPVSISDGATGWFGLGPVAVFPPCRGRGIGSQLVRAALRTLRERGASGCVLLGDPGYYGRFGFRAAPELVFAGVPTQYFQAMSFDSSNARGVVSYPTSRG